MGRFECNELCDSAVGRSLTDSKFRMSLLFSKLSTSFYIEICSVCCSLAMKLSKLARFKVNSKCLSDQLHYPLSTLLDILSRCNQKVLSELGYMVC